MTAKKSARQHARERGALDGADAQALEHALTQTERERDEALAKYQFMVNRAADEKLDGYRELASRLAAMEADRDELRRVVDEFLLYHIPAHVAEIERLRGKGTR